MFPTLVKYANTKHQEFIVWIGILRNKLENIKAFKSLKTNGDCMYLKISENVIVTYISGVKLNQFNC